MKFCVCCERAVHRGDWYFLVGGQVVRRRCHQDPDAGVTIDAAAGE